MRYLENIWRRIIHQDFIYKSPPNILQIYASFQSYFQKYNRSRQHWSRWSPGTNWLTHWCSQRPKQAWQFWWYLSNRSIFLKIFEGELSIRSLTTTFLEIFCELLLYSQVILINKQTILSRGTLSVNGLMSLSFSGGCGPLVRLVYNNTYARGYRDKEPKLPSSWHND